MPRKSTAWAAVCAAALLGLAGCQFFGIDTRPDIRYVTEKQRKDVKEPMYSMSVPGTGLFKQWPMRLGPEYGYAPWEKKPGTVGPDGKVVGGAAIAANGPTGGAPGANVPGADVAAAKTPAGVELTTPAKGAAKPSLRATPRLADGDLAAAQGTAANSQASAELLAAAEEYGFAAGRPEQHAATGAQGAGPAMLATAKDRAVAAPMQEAPRFRPPMKAGTPAAAAAVTAKTRSTARSQLPPAAEDLPWRPAYEETSGDATGEQVATADGLTTNEGANEVPAVDLYASDDAGATDYAAQESPATSSGITLQQPASFAARKTVAKKPNTMRDKAVRPAGAELPAAAPKKPRRVTRADIRVPEELGSELVPPTDDPLDDMANKLSDIEAVRPESQVSGVRGQGAGIDEEASSASQREYAEAETDETVYAGSRYLQPHAGEQELAASGYVGDRGREMPGQYVAAPAAAMARPLTAGRGQYGNEAVAEGSDEPVFVTASDMGDEDVPVASSRARVYENPYAEPQYKNGGSAMLSPPPDARPTHANSMSSAPAEDAGVMSEYEAAKRLLSQ